VGDVHILVREHQPQPVVGVPDLALRRRRHGGKLDQVVGQDGRPAVRDVSLVHEDHVDAAAWRAQPRVHLGGHLFDEAQEPSGERLGPS
jgi:hypothetical protein